MLFVEYFRSGTLRFLTPKIASNPVVASKHSGVGVDKIIPITQIQELGRCIIAG